MRAHQATQREERVAAGPVWDENHSVFAHIDGRGIERKSDWRAWNVLLNEAGVREVRLDDGRHTAATLLLSAGLHPRVVMRCSATHRENDDGHLQPRRAGTGPRGGRPDGTSCCPVRGGTTAPTAVDDRGQDKESPAQRVELRRLEPLTPSLPGRLRVVHGHPLSSIPAGQAAYETVADDLEPA